MKKTRWREGSVLRAFGEYGLQPRARITGAVPISEKRYPQGCPQIRIDLDWPYTWHTRWGGSPYSADARGAEPSRERVFFENLREIFGQMNPTKRQP